MNFDKFLEIYGNKPFIESSTYSLYTSNPDILRVQVNKWKQKRYLLELKKGLYVFSQKYRKYPASRLLIANYLVYPSYISLEYALGFYDLIPEMVSVFTSITTKKTNRFRNEFGLFKYNSIKKSLFFGYEMKNIDNENIFIASPEKAILDYFYINGANIGTNNISGFKDNCFEYFKSLRLQNFNKINTKSLKKYSGEYPKKFKDLTKALLEYIKVSREAFKKTNI